jgi:hypothetical protein
MHFPVKPLVHVRWRAQKQIDISTDVVEQFMLKREENAKLAGGWQRVHYSSAWSIMQWGNEGSLEKMAARQCILALACIRTNAATVAKIFFGVIEHSEWFAVLREEIYKTINEYDKPGQNMSIKKWVQHLEKIHLKHVARYR